MKKIILYSIFSILLCLNCVQAQETMTMPTDAEIMQTIEKFNFAPEQKEYLFKETKKKLQQIYSGANIETVMDVQTAIPQTTNVNKSVQTEVKKTEKRTKKYTSHPPLTRRSARED